MPNHNDKPQDWPENLPFPGEEAMELSVNAEPHTRRRLWCRSYGFLIEARDQTRDEWYSIASLDTKTMNTLAAAHIERALRREAEELQELLYEIARKDSAYPVGEYELILGIQETREEEIAQCRAWDEEQRQGGGD